MALALRGTVLPARERMVLRVEGDTLRIGAREDDELVADGVWLVPGLVDVHTHPGMEKPGDPFRASVFRRQMVEHRDAGVLLVRSPGSPEPRPGALPDDPELPRLRSGGQWLATPGRFFEGYGRRVTEDELVTAAVEEARASSGWCKIIGDWLPGVPAVPLDVLSAAVAAVHAAGGRVAVHSQTAAGSRNAVLAGADSLEHGMYLDHDLLPRMAEQGTALVPTFTTFAKSIEQLRTGNGPAHILEWLVGGWDSLCATVPAAHEAGVTVLAGTDCKPCGDVATEVGWLVRAGLPVKAAVGAASWTARAWLGMPGLVAGGPADVVAYDADPLEDPDVLHHPKVIILRGRRIL